MDIYLPGDISGGRAAVVLLTAADMRLAAELLPAEVRFVGVLTTATAVLPLVPTAIGTEIGSSRENVL